MANDISPPDYGSAVGKVRALIPDIEEVDWENDGNASYLFTDSHLEGLLSLYPTSETPDDVPYSSTAPLRRAAADAVEALATSEVLISKVIKTEDLQTDGAKAANALLARAGMLRRAADKEDDNAYLDTAFTIVDFESARNPLDPMTVRTAAFDAVWNQT